jgi:hypothetical protein
MLSRPPRAVRRSNAQSAVPISGDRKDVIVAQAPGELRDDALWTEARPDLAY